MGGWVLASDVTPSRPRTSASPSPSSPFMQKLATVALEIKQSYDTNPILKVGGFSIGTTPPDLTLNFEFK